MKLKLRDACYKVVKGIAGKEIKHDESYQKAVKEANRRIEESREQERRAWQNASSYLASERESSIQHEEESISKKKMISLYELLCLVSNLEKFPDMSKECTRELMTSYYQALALAKINGTWDSIEIDITSCTHLVQFLESKNHFHGKFKTLEKEKNNNKKIM